MANVTKQQKAKQKKTMFYMGAALAILFGVILLAAGAQNASFRSKTGGNPQSISLAELARNGPGEHEFIELTDFRYGDDYVYSETDAGAWNNLWVPLFADQDNQKPVAVAFLMRGGEKAFRQQLEATTLKGLVKSKRERLTGTIHGQLKKSYTNLDPNDEFWVIKGILIRPSETGVMISLVSGLAILGIGVFLIVMGKFAR